jgi:serine/threonine-protein kinase HipA
MLTLAPAFDICPQARSGGEATQAMIIGEEDDPFKLSQVRGCIDRAHIYHLSKTEASEIVAHQIETIERDWEDVCAKARLPKTERERLWRRQFLNPFSLEGYRG